MSGVWKTAGQDGRVAYLADGASAASDFLTVMHPDRAAAPAGGGAVAAAVVPSSVAIGLCTAFRPKMLESCLGAIGALVAPAGVKVHVIVADNEPQPGNEQV